MRFIHIQGKNNIIRVDPEAVMRNVHIAIQGDNNRLYLGKGLYTGRFQLIGDNNTMTIGNGGTIMNADIIVAGEKKITIGNGCAFSEMTDIRTTDHHPIFNRHQQRINPDQDVYIGDRVWLARNVDVLKGSVIESDVVIGVKSVVTGRIPAHSVAVGVPARVVQEKITWRET